MVIMQEPTAVEREKIANLITGVTGPWREFLDTDLWENVVVHCMMEAARGFFFSDILGFDPGLKKDLVMGLVLHDGFKRREITAIQDELAHGGTGLSASIAVTRDYISRLRACGVPERSLLFINSIGGKPDVLVGIKKILDKASLTDDDWAVLVAHYIDDYTRDGNWVEPASDGMNDVDRRILKNRNNQNYTRMNQESAQQFEQYPIFSGKDACSVMALLDRIIEKDLTALIAKRSQKTIAPLELPEVIDAELKRKVSAIF